MEIASSDPDVGALVCKSCGHGRSVDNRLMVALARKLNLHPHAIEQEHFSVNIGLFRCIFCDAKAVEFVFTFGYEFFRAQGIRKEMTTQSPAADAAHAESRNSGLNRTNRDRAQQFAQQMYGKMDEDFERQYIDEGIAGTREDNMRARTRLSAEMRSRGRE